MDGSDVGGQKNKVDCGGTNDQYCQGSTNTETPKEARPDASVPCFGHLGSIWIDKLTKFSKAEVLYFMCLYVHAQFLQKQEKKLFKC